MTIENGNIYIKLVAQESSRYLGFYATLCRYRRESRPVPKITNQVSVRARTKYPISAQCCLHQPCTILLDQFIQLAVGRWREESLHYHFPTLAEENLNNIVMRDCVLSQAIAISGNSAVSPCKSSSQLGLLMVSTLFSSQHPTAPYQLAVLQTA